MKIDYLFKALGEETKYRILKSLLQGELCVCELSKKINRTQSNTSMHLAKLIKWGLIKSRRSGKLIFYSINDKRINKIFKIVENI